MFNRRTVVLIALSFCFFESIGESKNSQAIDKKLGKSVSSFVVTFNFNPVETFYYTTELSRILLVGESRWFEVARCVPFVNSILLIPKMLNNRFLDNRFEKFVKKGEKYSLFQLQEAVKDAIVLTSYNTNAYSVSILLDYLSAALQSKISNIKNQVKHDFKWDQQSFSSLKKSGAWALGLGAFRVIADKYFTVEDEVSDEVSTLDFFNAIAAGGLLLVSYQVLKNGYKILTVNPNAGNESLGKYEELLLFVRQLKEQLETNQFVTFTLPSGYIATIKNDLLNTVTFS